MKARLASALFIVTLGIGPGLAAAAEDDPDEHDVDTTPLVAAPVEIVRVLVAAPVQIVRVPATDSRRLVAAPVEIVRVPANDRRPLVAARVEIVRVPASARPLVAAPVEIVRIPVDKATWVTRVEPAKPLR
jgi:hypothetical protein